VVLFGSRAKGTQKIASDVDLAIKGKAVTYATAVRLADMLNEEKPLPYFFDVLHYESIIEPRLLEHIDRVGIVLYARKSASIHQEIAEPVMHGCTQPQSPSMASGFRQPMPE
jgi:predicted nucleotidyltransferase